MIPDEKKISDTLIKLSEEKKSDSVKSAFRDMSRKKFQSAFIFPLAEIEEVFGYLWREDEEDYNKLTPEEKRFRDAYEALRKRVLDNGNNIIRNFDKELECLVINLKVFNYKG